MLVVAVIFFLIAGFLGTFLLAAILRNKPTPKPIVFMHGTVAGIALLIFAVYLALGHAVPLLITSLVLFILAALGGLTMFTLDINGKPVPKMLAIGHPILAVTSVVLLLVYLFS